MWILVGDSAISVHTALALALAHCGSNGGRTTGRRQHDLQAGDHGQGRSTTPRADQQRPRSGNCQSSQEMIPRTSRNNLAGKCNSQAWYFGGSGYTHLFTTYLRQHCANTAPSRQPTPLV